MSRANILSAIQAHQPPVIPLPKELSFEYPDHSAVIEKFIQTVTLIGGKVIMIDTIQDINLYALENFILTDRLVTPIAELNFYTPLTGNEWPHQFANTDFAVFKPHFAVAENGAVWITEDRMGHRVLPFICQHLGMVLEEDKIVADMHEAYRLIGNEDYGFGTFIAGPSKTADIEQSLVLGAHGARSMTVFLLKQQDSELSPRI